MRTDILDRHSDIQKWIKENKSKAFMCKQLSCKPITLDRALGLLNISYAGNKGGKGKVSATKKTALEYLQSSCVKSHTAKIKLLHDGIKEHRCEICNKTEWLGSSIPLELDHIDGDHYNNSLENIRLLCPNCHSTLPTNSGKNKAIKNKARLDQW